MGSRSQYRVFATAEAGQSEVIAIDTKLPYNSRLIQLTLSIDPLPTTGGFLDVTRLTQIVPAVDWLILLRHIDCTQPDLFPLVCPETTVFHLGDHIIVDYANPDDCLCQIELIFEELY